MLDTVIICLTNTVRLNNLEKLKLVRERILPQCGMRGPSASCFAVAVGPTAHWERAHFGHNRSNHKPSFSSYVNVWTVITELYEASLLFLIFPYCIFSSLLYLRSLHFSSIVCFQTFTFTSIYSKPSFFLTPLHLAKTCRFELKMSRDTIMISNLWTNELLKRLNHLNQFLLKQFPNFSEWVGNQLNQFTDCNEWFTKESKRTKYQD